ncbi:MAG TPA: hypothetical protein VJK01_02530 [Candidatus Paceibacterota bacterium]
MKDETTQNDSPDEEEMAQDLRRERASTQTVDETEQEDEAEQEIGQENKEANPVDAIMVVMNILGDAFDYIGIGAIPVLGDILDAAIAGYNTLVSWKTKKEVRMKAILAAAVGPFIIEVFGAFIAPILNDLLPSFIVGTLISRVIIKKVMKKAGLKDNV